MACRSNNVLQNVCFRADGWHAGHTTQNVLFLRLFIQYMSCFKNFTKTANTFKKLHIINILVFNSLTFPFLGCSYPSVFSIFKSNLFLFFYLQLAKFLWRVLFRPKRGLAFSHTSFFRLENTSNFSVHIFYADILRNFLD